MPYSHAPALSLPGCPFLAGLPEVTPSRAVFVLAAQRLAFSPAAQTKRLQIERAGLALGDPLAQAFADRRRFLEAGAAEASGQIESFRPDPIEDRLAVENAGRAPTPGFPATWEPPLLASLQARVRAGGQPRGRGWRAT